MSGPKVVNVENYRRQQERQALRAMRQLNVVIDNFIAAQLSTDRSNTLIADARNTLRQIEAFRHAGDWDSIINRATAYAKYLSSEFRHEQQAENERQLNRLKQHQHLIATSRMLLDQCDKFGIARPPSLVHMAEGGGDVSQSDLGREISSVLAFLANRADTDADQQRSSMLRAITGQFEGEGDRIVTVAEHFLKTEDNAYADELNRIAQILSNLSSQCEANEVAPLQLLAKQIAGETDISKRRLLVDSFMLKASDASRLAKEREDAVAKLEAALILLAPFSGSEAKTFEERVRWEFRAPDLKKAKLVYDQIDTWCAEQQCLVDASDRRNAVLSALSQLGYEVREGMSVGLAEQGKVIVRKPAEVGYGVEIVLPARTPAMQVRVVAFREACHSNLDQQMRDKEMEEKWCSEFGQLQDLLQRQGMNLKLQQQRAPGELAVKMVGIDAGGGALRARAIPPSERTKTL